MQYSLFIAQKEYARTGDEDQAEMLVNLLVGRAKETDRTLKQVVLNEAISVAPKLTVSQYEVLSVILAVRNITFPEPDDLTGLIDIINSIILILPNYTETHGSTSHLLFTGCCTVQEKESIATIVRERYSYLFSKGFAKEEFYQVFHSREQGMQIGDKILNPCLHNPKLWQPNIKLNNYKLFKLREEMNIDLLRLQRFFSSYLMSSQEVNLYLYEVIPKFNELNTIWDNIGGMNLTSVGIAIAQANLRKCYNFEFSDLTVWLY